MTGPAAGSAGGSSRGPRAGNWRCSSAAKSLFFSLALAVPLLMHPLWAVLLLYFAVSLIQGLALSVVFQLAHCVEEAAFPLPAPDTGRMETRLGRTPGRNDRRFRPPELAALVVHRRAEFPDRAPPLPPHLPCPLPGDCAAGRGDLPGIRTAVTRPTRPSWQASVPISAGCGGWVDRTPCRNDEIEPAFPRHATSGEIRAGRPPCRRAVVCRGLRRTASDGRAAACGGNGRTIRCSPPRWSTRST